MTNKISRRSATYLFCVSVLLTTAAQLLFRSAMLRSELALGDPSIDAVALLSSLPPEAVGLLMLGLLCYTISMLAWIPALSRFDVSVAYPVLSITYILVYLGAVNIPSLHESASLLKGLGIGVIVLGVSLVATSSGESAETRHTRH